MKDEDGWKRLAGSGSFIGGAVRDKDERGRPTHRRISRIEVDDAIVSFRFDRVAARNPDGAWVDLPLDGNDFLWFPKGFIAIEFDDAGVARLGSRALPSFIEGVYPRSSLPADSPAFAVSPAN